MYGSSVHMKNVTETVSVTRLRGRLQEFLAKVERGQRLRITSRGRVIAEIGPPAPLGDEARAARERLRGSVLKYEDPLLPVFEPGDWDMHR